MHVLVVGAGNMAQEYIKVLDVLNVPFSVIGRGSQKVEKLKNKYNIKISSGGLEAAFTSHHEVSHAIVATSLASLEKNVEFLIEKKVKNILVEKPGSVTLQGIQNLASKAKENGINIYIAYNRRFYASVIEAKKRIIEDGGLKSFVFEFTEWSHVLETLNRPQFELENWFIGNSTHVLDTAFHIGGKPKIVNGFVQNHLNWHSKGSIFVGAGLTDRNIPFSYHANWESPGSWKLELLTKSNRYILRPFEELHVQKLGKLIIEPIAINNEIDIIYKPGLYKQLEQFLFEIKHSEMLSIEEGQQLFEWYEHILKQ